MPYFGEYVVFRAGEIHYIHAADITRIACNLPYVVGLDGKLLDVSWMCENIGHDYMGIFYGEPEAVPFYFEDAQDAFVFKLRFGVSAS